MTPELHAYRFFQDNFPMKKTLVVILLLVVACFVMTPQQQAHAQRADFDFVIANGRVMDPESKLDAVRYVGIRGKSIAPVPSNAAAYGAISPIPVIPTGGQGDASQFPRGTWADQNGVSYMRGYLLNNAGTQADASQGCSVINAVNHAAPYSFHSGGVNALRCDGSVSFMKETIAGTIMVAFVTRNGGENPPLDQ